MPISDTRNANAQAYRFRELLTPSYVSLFARLFQGKEGAITTHGDNYTSVKINYNVIDEGSATPTIRAEETNTLNHYKFVNGRENFFPVVRDGIISTKVGTANVTALANAALRLETINFDRAMLLGADGNKGLLIAQTNDLLRVTLTGDALELPNATATFETRANAVQALGTAFRAKIDETSMAQSGVVLIYGADLKAYLSATNTTTDNLSLLDYFRKGLDMQTAIVKVQDRLIAGSALTNGITFVDLDSLTADVGGESKFPTATKTQNEVRDSFEYDVVRISRGSVQVTPGVEGGIINAAVTIKEALSA